MWGSKFWPPTSCLFPFSFLLHSPSTSPPPLTLFTFFFLLIFLLYLSINISLDPCVLSIFITHPFLVKPIFNTHFLCIKMASSSKGSSFLVSHGKKYDPTFDWHDDDGLLQDPRTHAPYCHVDTKVSFSLVSLLGEILLHVSLKV